MKKAGGGSYGRGDRRQRAHSGGVGASNGAWHQAARRGDVASPGVSSGGVGGRGLLSKGHCVACTREGAAEDGHAATGLGALARAQRRRSAGPSWADRAQARYSPQRWALHVRGAKL